MLDRVQILPRPTVINHDGLPVAHAQVLDIVFLGETIDTPTGPMNIIVGPGIAKIMVGSETVRGVPLC